VTTVHLILNSHIDPIWLWPWTSGLDTLLNTCRSMCDRLDAHPDVHFCKGEAWGYQMIERIDPALFDRIRRHVQAARWHIVGGWWIQPDCNGPSGFALSRQIEVGKQYLLDRFGYFPRDAYNVDSFGHAASLPTIMRAAGQDRYVFMRPQEHEMKLPARVFRWCEREGSLEVVAFHIAKTYATRDMSVDLIQAALVGLPQGIDHTMCFVGIGDHGGGPTERQITWCREHADAIDGCRLVFSSPGAFFDAIWDRKDTLPLLTGELQMHAIGCYSVYRPIKVAVRRAEHLLRQAECALPKDPRPDPAAPARLTEAWRHVVFNHFHDTFGGTCIPSAYRHAENMLGAAAATAEEIIQTGMRRQMTALPDDPHQRIVLFNAGEDTYDGYATHLAWFETVPCPLPVQLLDGDGRVVPHQVMNHEAPITWDKPYFVPFLLRDHVAPGELRVLRIVPLEAGAQPPASQVHAGADELSNDVGVRVRLGGTGGMEFGAARVPLPRLALLDDPSDTWSHDIDRYAETPSAPATWETPKVIDTGPLMASLRRRGRSGDSELIAEYRVYAGEPFVELLLRVHWRERHKLLKLVQPLSAGMVRHFDGIPGSELERRPLGHERPVRDRTLLELKDGQRIGIVLPDAYALDATPERARITLLRSPLMAHHDPCPADAGPRGVYADHGVNEFRFRFFCGRELTGAELDRHALLLHRPLATADLTRGMRADA